MSLQKLLAEHPNYSARKVRRLAKQLATLEKIDLIAHPDAKGIGTDLMDFHLLSAKVEDRLADVSQVTSNPFPVSAEHGDRVTDRLSVTPVSAANKAIDVLVEWLRIHTDATLANDALTRVLQQARGHINGQAFTTDRTAIQARMSPQE